MKAFHNKSKTKLVGITFSQEYFHEKKNHSSLADHKTIAMLDYINDSTFLYASMVCLLGYIVRSILFAMLLNGKVKLGKGLNFSVHGVMGVVWAAWFLMVFNDPVEVQTDMWVKYVGVFVIVIGLFMNLSAEKTFTRESKLFEANEKPSPIIKIDLYAKLRHPMYTGLVIVMVGFCTMLGALGTLICSGVISLFYISWSIAEERSLVKKYPNEYTAYRKQTWF